MLKPRHHTDRSDSEEELRLLFSNYATDAAAMGQTGTQVELHGWTGNNTLPQESCWVVIQ